MHESSSHQRAETIPSHPMRLDRTDSGAVLPMVLAFITVIGLIVGAMLTQASANFQATTALRDNRNRVFAADAGLEWALARSATLTAGLTGLADPVTCAQTLTVNAASVAVSCSGTRDQFTVTSVATKDGSTSTARAVLVRLPAGFYVPREWNTASS